MARRVRKRRSSNNTETEMASRASAKKILDPTGTGAAENMNMALRGGGGHRGNRRDK